MELTAPEEVRLARNMTENRIRHKPSKADAELSNHLMEREKQFRLESLERELPFEHYLRIDNTDLPAEEAARQIKEAFGL